MRFLLLTLYCVAPLFFLAQEAPPISFGTGDIGPVSQASLNVNASDGVYDKFVLVRWEPTDRGGAYRLFRATSASGASLRELTKTWQKSTWFCDYSAEKGRDYYYAIMESDEKKSTALSSFDKGFLRKSENIANDESLSAATPDKYAAGKTVFVLVSEVVADSNTYIAGSVVPLSIGLQNIFDEATPRTDLRVYLSLDSSWDFEDQFLISKTYSGFPAGFKGNLQEKIRLPEKLLPGNYYLLVVSAPEGNILNAKIGATQINITGQ